jgi:hypothetical protein
VIEEEHDDDDHKTCSLPQNLTPFVHVSIFLNFIFLVSQQHLQHHKPMNKYMQHSSRIGVKREHEFGRKNWEILIEVYFEMKLKTQWLTLCNFIWDFVSRNEMMLMIVLLFLHAREKRNESDFNSLLVNKTGCYIYSLEYLNNNCLRVCGTWVFIWYRKFAEARTLSNNPIYD